MKTQTIYKELAKLETKLDLMETELSHLNCLLKKCGFSQGIETLKSTIFELLKEDKNKFL